MFEPETPGEDPYVLTDEAETQLNRLAEISFGFLEDIQQTTRARMLRAYFIAADELEQFQSKFPEDVMALVSLYERGKTAAFRELLNASVGAEIHLGIMEVVHLVRTQIMVVMRTHIQGVREAEVRLSELDYQMIGDVESDVDALGVDFLTDDARSDAEFDAHFQQLEDLPEEIERLKGELAFIRISVADKMIDVLMMEDVPEDIPPPKLRVI